MVESFLSDLHERDAFALGLFHTRTRWFQQQMVRAEASTVQQAIDYLKKTRDSGGTNLGVALEQGLSLPRMKDTPARHVLVVTDAQVSDAGRILRLADSEAKQKERRRISVICIDAAPNSFLATELAARGGGVSYFLTSNPKEGDITTALVEVLADWAEPVLAGLQLEVNRSHVETTGHESSSQGTSSRIDLGDLPAGRAIWVAGRVPRGTEPLDFRLTAYDGHQVAALQVDSAQAESHRALKALFGARRILGLEYLIDSGYQGKQLEEQLRRLGYDPQEALTGSQRSKIYAENVRQDAQKALRELLVQESLDYGLASAETAFVAVRQEADKPVEGTVAVANALPSGWDGSFLTGPTPMQARGALRRSPARSPSMTRSAGLDFLRSAPLPPQPSAPPQPAAPFPNAFKYEMESSRRTAQPAEPVAPKRAKKRSIFGRLLDKVTGESGGEKAEESKRDFMPALEMEAPAPQAARPSGLLFSGIPKTDGSQQTVLFDSSSAQSSLPAHVTLRGLQVDFPNGAPNHRQLDRELSLLLFVGDLSQPRAQIRLTDIIRMRGKRPLNLVKQASDAVRLVLFDPNGAWKAGAPAIQVTLRW
jgi:Ca-activated chloride channel family protein